MGTLVSEEDVVVDVMVMLVKESIVLVIVDVSVCTLGWNKLMMSKLECEVRAAFYSFFEATFDIVKAKIPQRRRRQLSLFPCILRNPMHLADEVHSKEDGPMLRIIIKMGIEMEDSQFP